jgi:Tripartite tricarboxylate transporter family receptor
MRNRKREICTSGSARDEDGQPPHLLGRRNFLHLAAGAAALPAVSRFAWAQAYPTRPVRLIEGFGAGSAPDIVARLIGQSLSEQLGQSFVVENRSGAASNIATDAVARASPDGYTLLLITSTNAINTTLYDKLSFDFIRDIVPIASIARVPLVMEVHPSGQDRCGIHRLCQGQSRQGQHGISGNYDPDGRRNVQDDGGPRPISRALSRRAGVSRAALPARPRSILVRCSPRLAMSGPVICAPWR